MKEKASTIAKSNYVSKTILLHKFLRYAGILFLLFLLAPTSIYQMPETGLDGSWAIALQMAIAKKMIFGKDFIFTYGPLGYLATRLPIGISKFVYLLFDIFILSNLAFVLYYLFKSSQWFIIFLFSFVCILLLGYFYTADVVIMLTWILLFLFFHFLHHQNVYVLIDAILITILIFFIKLNVGIVSGMLLYIFIIYAIFTKLLTLKQAILSIGSHIVGISLLCLVLKVNLPGYIVGSLHLIDAYNDAMYAFEREHQIAYYMAIGILLCYSGLFLLCIKTFLRDTHSFFVYSFTAIVLYITFKQGFVRADVHVFSFFKFIACFIGLVVIFSRSLLKKASFVLLIISICFACIKLVNFNYTLNPTVFAFKFATAKEYISGILHSDYSPDYDKLKSEGKIPNHLLQLIGDKSVDIIPWEISFIHFNNLNYNPRPVIQSYSAYDAYLDRLNYEKYMSASAPEFILFKLESIDFRHDLYDETQTKLAVLLNYEVIDRSWDYLLLKKLKTPLQQQVIKTTAGIYNLGEYIEIDDSQELQVAQVNVSYSFLGKLRRLLFQPPMLMATVQFEDGSEQTGRAVKTIINGGIIINRYVIRTRRSTDAFITYYGKKNKKIVKVKFDAPQAWGFNPTFEVEKKYIHIEDYIKKADTPLDETPISQAIPLPVPTNNINMSFEIFDETEEYIEMSGWAYIEGTNIEDSNKYIVLKGKANTLIYPAQMLLRKDLSKAMNKNLDKTGFYLILSKKNIPKDNYQVGIFISTKKAQALKYTTSTLGMKDREFTSKVTNIDIPAPSNNMQVSIDALEDKQTVFSLKGW